MPEYKNASGKCIYDKRCACPPKAGRRALNGCDNCPLDAARNLADKETLMLYDVPDSWRKTLNQIKRLPVARGR